MSEIYDKAVAAFGKGWYCGESVLLVVAEEMAIESPHIPAMASGFCSGIARSCGMCGAVSGGILALNLLYGRKTSETDIGKNFSGVQALLSRFEAEFKSTNCRHLIDCDLGTPEGQQKFEKHELWHQCQHYTGRAAEMTVEVINEISKA